MQILNIAGYKFVPLTDCDQIRTALRSICEAQTLKGTILLSTEGINISLAGLAAHVRAFQQALAQDERFNDLSFHETYSATVPFRHLKIKIKKEIITFRQPMVNATHQRAPSISPAQLKQWLDENRDFILLDTRNDYEVDLGTFETAVRLPIQDFGQFPAATNHLPNDKTIVMFCTGGIRCEKAALYMLNAGYSNIYQLDTGILGYFAQIGGAHYQGECFVFDERTSVTPNLVPGGFSDKN